MKDVLAEILKLSTEEKILLVEALWDDIAAESSQREKVLSEEEKNFLNDRLETYERNPDKVRPLEEFLNELLQDKP